MEDENNPPEDEIAPELPAEPSFTQEQLNAAVQKAKAQAKRSAKREFESQVATNTTIEEPTISTEHPAPVLDPRIDQLVDGLAALKATNDDQAFAAQIAGLQLSEDDLDIAKTLQSTPAQLAKFINRMRAPDAPPPAKTGTFTGLDAPNPIPSVDRQTNPVNWSQEDIAVMRKDGTFLKRVNEYKAGLPGGDGGLFKPKGFKK